MEKNKDLRNKIDRGFCYNPINQDWTMETSDTTYISGEAAISGEATFSNRDFVGLNQIINKRRSNTKNRSRLTNIKNSGICCNVVDNFVEGVGHFDYKKWDFLLAIYKIIGSNFSRALWNPYNSFRI